MILGTWACSSCVIGAGTWNHVVRFRVSGSLHTRRVQGSRASTTCSTCWCITRVWVMMSGTCTTSSGVIGAWNHRREVKGFGFTTHKASSGITRLDHLLDMLVQHSGLGNDVGDVHDLLWRHGNRDLGTAWFPEASVPNPDRPQRSAPHGNEYGSV